MVLPKINNEQLIHRQSPELLTARDLVPLVAKSDSYRRTRNAIENESDTDNRMVAIFNGAEELKNHETKGEYLTLLGHQFNMTSHLVTFMESVQTLNTLDERNASSQERRPFTEAVASFNHALKEMVDDNPRLQYQEVLQFLRETHQAIHGIALNKPFENNVRARLTGIRHEIGVEQMLYQIPDIEIEETTVQDDLQGGDIRVSLDGVHFYNIDIKASAFTAERRRQDAAYHGSSRIIIWSHLDEGDFNGSFHIPSETASKKAPELFREIKSAIFSRRGSVALKMS